MSSAVMFERSGVTMPGVTPTGVSAPHFGPTPTMPATPNWLMVPRCTFKFEKLKDGMKVSCICDDKLACSMVQNLCGMVTGGLCSCWLTYNGMSVCSFNFTMGMCKWETFDKGVTFHCTSGDKQCCEMIQSFCECISSMVKSGCTCCWMVGSTPLCCGC
jgi:hypothetical protein